MSKTDEINWNALRIRDGSQHLSFEQFCRQIIGAECIEVSGRWIAKEKIDAGVEGLEDACFGNAQLFIQSCGWKKIVRLNGVVRRGNHSRISAVISY